MNPNGMFIANVLATVLLTSAIGYFFYNKQAKRRRPVWTHKTVRLIGGRSVFKSHIPGRGKIRQVSITKVVLWNAGKESIEKQDVRRAINIAFPSGDEILYPPTILQASREVTGFSATKKKNDVVVDFDFLEKGDGALIEIVYSSQRKLKRGAFNSIPLLSALALARRGQRPYYPTRLRDTNDLVSYDFISKNNASLIEVIEDTGELIGITGTIRDVRKGIELVNARKRGAKLKIATLSSIFILGLLAAPFLYAHLSPDVGLQGLLNRVVSAPLFVVFALLPLVPFSYWIARLLASVAEFPPWLDYRYL